MPGRGEFEMMNMTETIMVATAILLLQAVLRIDEGRERMAPMTPEAWWVEGQR